MRPINLLLAALFASVPAQAERTSSWNARAAANVTTTVAGYRPGLIVEEDTESFNGRRDQTERARFDADLQLRLPYFEAQFQPYTIAPSEHLRVNLAGIEAHMRIVPVPAVQFGFYHHSTHNFSRPAGPGSPATEPYGEGVELDGLTLRLRPFAGTSPIAGYGGRYQWQFNGYWFFPGYQRNATPYVLTEDTVLERGQTGRTAWRANSRFEAFNRFGAADAGLQLQWSEEQLASVLFDASVTARLTPFGTIGNHFLVGPVFTYGANLSREHRFGVVQAWLGLRLTVLLADDDDDSLR